jgi:hypothetical protein
MDNEKSAAIVTALRMLREVRNDDVRSKEYPAGGKQ